MRLFEVILLQKRDLAAESMFTEPVTHPIIDGVASDGSDNQQRQEPFDAQRAVGRKRSCCKQQ